MIDATTTPTTGTPRERTISVPVAPSGYNFDGVSSGHGPCVCCGRDVQTMRYGVVMIDGGGRLAHPSDDAFWRDSGETEYMGLQPVGPECRKLLPDEYVIRLGK